MKILSIASNRLMNNSINFKADVAILPNIVQKQRKYFFKKCNNLIAYKTDKNLLNALKQGQ